MFPTEEQNLQSETEKVISALLDQSKVSHRIHSHHSRHVYLGYTLSGQHHIDLNRGVCEGARVDTGQRN